ncbi:hypothetical protein Pelo_14497 [Pelomyxa schiedti]|nr:hypothetical protein Pelo_14497 [Pelomyxa schiedti]
MGDDYKRQTDEIPSTSGSTLNPLTRKPHTKEIQSRGILRLPNDLRALILLVLCVGMGVLGILSFFCGGILSWFVAIGSIACAVFGVIGAYLQNAFCFFLCMGGFICISILCLISLIFNHGSYEIGVYLSDCFVGLATAFVCFMMRGYSLKPC